MRTQLGGLVKLDGAAFFVAVARRVVHSGSEICHNEKALVFLRKVFRVVRTVVWVGLILFLLVVPARAQSDGQFVVTCADGRQIVGLRVSLQDLTVGGGYRLTLFGEPGFDPAMAIIRGDETVTCSDNDGSLTGAQIALSSSGRWQGTAFSTQASIIGGPDTNIELIVGGFPGESGQFALVVEGFSIDPAGETDAIYIDVPPSAAGEWLSVLMIGNDTVNPYLELATLNSDGIYTTTQACDDATVRECGTVPPLVDNGVVLSESERVVGDAFDAGIVTAPQSGRLWYTFSASRGATTGGYAIFITGIAPGDAVVRDNICSNVAARVSSASPAYNELYNVDAVLDGDPETRWVTSAPTSGQRAFLVIGLSDTVIVDSVRVNGFVNERRANAIKQFDIAIPNGERQSTIAASVEAAVRPGYQRYPIVPARVDEIALVLNETQGGGLFEIVDVQVCAAR